MMLVHHELCFGCGRSNLFGLLFEAERSKADQTTITGRCFIKQDHQGPERGYAHPGVVAAALIEAMAFACGSGVSLQELALELNDGVPVGAFLAVEARASGLEATARSLDYRCAARGTFKACRSA